MVLCLSMASSSCDSDVFCAPEAEFSSLTILGILMSFVGNFVNSVGYILQKIGYQRLLEKQQAEPNLEHKIWSEGIWVAGFVTYAVGSLTHGAALGFASQALLVPMEGVTLVANAFLAPIFLGEKLGTAEMLGSLICCIGIAITVLFGPNSEQEYTTDDLLEFWYTPQFLIYGSLQAGAGVFAYCTLLKVRAINRAENVEYDGQTGAMDMPRAKLAANLHTAIAGVLAAFNVLFLKTVSTVLLNSPEPASERFSTPWPYVFIVAFILCNLSMEIWKQKALQQFESVYIVPVFQAALIVLAVLTGGVFFKEFNSMAALNLVIFFVVGLATVAAGVFVLAHTQESKFAKLIRVKLLNTIKALRAMGGLGGLGLRSRSNTVVPVEEEEEEGKTPSLVGANKMPGVGFAFGGSRNASRRPSEAPDSTSRSGSRRPSLSPSQIQRSMSEPNSMRASRSTDSSQTPIDLSPKVHKLEPLPQKTEAPPIVTE